jgi:parallel beta-helix repeat protein
MRKSAGIVIENSKNVTAEDNIVSGYDQGIVSKNSTNVKLNRNKVFNSINLRWFGTWWGILIISIIAGLVVFEITKLF